MTGQVAVHYGGQARLVDRLEGLLNDAGVKPHELSAADFEPVDEFHFRGREATLELLADLQFDADAHVLDIGSGLGGLSRTIADEVGCRTTGVDLTPAFCEVATAISKWVGLGEKTAFQQGDATALSFPDDAFDGAVTAHVAMNIPDKARLFAEAWRVLKSNARFAVYDILQGEGGEVAYPVPWAQDALISHLATVGEMEAHLTGAGFRILKETDSTEASHRWLMDRFERPAGAGLLPPTTRLLFGDTSKDMAQNQIEGLSERRILTYSFICEA